MVWTATMMVALVVCLLAYGLALLLLAWTVKVDRARLAALHAQAGARVQPSPAATG